MITFGIPSQQRLETLHVKPDGSPDWAQHVPPGLFLADSPGAPWNREARVIGQIDNGPLYEAVDRDPASYPGLLWTPPAVVPLVKLPQPALGPNQAAEPELVWHEDRVERAWNVVDVPPPTRIRWPDANAFLQILTTEQRAAIWSGTHPLLASLMLELLTWKGEVWSDDPRIQQGFQLLIALGIETQEGAQQKLNPPGLVTP